MPHAYERVHKLRAAALWRKREQRSNPSNGWNIDETEFLGFYYQAFDLDVTSFQKHQEPYHMCMYVQIMHVKIITIFLCKLWIKWDQFNICSKFSSEMFW